MNHVCLIFTERHHVVNEELTYDDHLILRLTLETFFSRDIRIFKKMVKGVRSEA